MSHIKFRRITIDVDNGEIIFLSNDANDYKERDDIALFLGWLN